MTDVDHATATGSDDLAPIMQSDPPALPTRWRARWSQREQRNSHPVTAQTVWRIPEGDTVASLHEAHMHYRSARAAQHNDQQVVPTITHEPHETQNVDSSSSQPPQTDLTLRQIRDRRCIYPQVELPPDPTLPEGWYPAWDPGFCMPYWFTFDHQATWYRPTESPTPWHAQNPRTREPHPAYPGQPSRATITGDREQVLHSASGVPAWNNQPPVRPGVTSPHTHVAHSDQAHTTVYEDSGEESFDSEISLS